MRLNIDNNFHNWREQVAYLPQQVFLIDDSIEKNIALGEEQSNIDKKQVESAIRKSKLEDLVISLPQGIDTNIGENGIRLSGGQRQRIALARAFYHNRSVLVLDESTSSLDIDTEDQILECIKDLKKGSIIKKEDLDFLRPCPEGSFHPYEADIVTGKKLQIDKKKNESILKQDIC